MQDWQRGSHCPQGQRNPGLAPPRSAWVAAVARVPKLWALCAAGARVSARVCPRVRVQWGGVLRLGVSFQVILVSNLLGDHGKKYSAWKDENWVSTQNFELETVPCDQMQAKPWQ